MVTVFQVTKAGFEPTRLFLACTAWGEAVRSSLVQMGFSVQPTDQSHEPDLRDAAELERRDALLTVTGL